MGRLLGTFGSLFAYVCIGTVIALAIILGYATTHGYLDKDKLLRIADVARGIEVVAAPVEQSKKQVEAADQPSFDDIERRRGIKARNLELREQSIESGLERIRFEQKKLDDEESRYKLLRDNFNAKVLDVDKEKAVQEGRDKIRLIWESMKPRQAKEQIVQMIDAGEMNEVVSILSAVATTKQAKIIAEFKTDEDVKKLDEILRLIRQGVPDVLPIDQAREQLKQFNPKTPQTAP
ncbi:MAG TPA: hypothetical protein VGY55_06495 [Pirellulales bacterium]|jgi:hypothetical protein|nr:hypothetical protein [Pirellulales bacterium]